MIGTIQIWSKMSLYLISYLKTINTSITLSDGTFLLPIAQFGFSGFTILGGLFEAKFGSKKYFNFPNFRTVFIGSILFVLGHTIIYISKSIYIAYLGMLIFGLGVAFNVHFI